jgi:hypothetical protein
MSNIVYSMSNVHAEDHIKSLRNKGWYAPNLPTANTRLERQGRDGEDKVQSYLSNQGYTTILHNQNVGDECKKHPDILAYHPVKGWIQAEVHYYIHTRCVDDNTSKDKDRGKTWIEGIPRKIIHANKIHYTKEALKGLEEAEIELINGIP